MRILAIIMNLIILGLLQYIVITEGYSTNDALKMELFSLIPLVNLYVLYFYKGGNWVALYFKRKALEEKAKIKLLNEKDS